MKTIVVLGSTGSIGVSTVDIVIGNPSRFKIVALSAGRNLSLLAKQIQALRPEVVSVIDEAHACRLKDMIGHASVPVILWGEEGSTRVASWRGADIVVSAIAGAAGLSPTMAAIEAGKDIALANKETMVMAGGIVMDRAASRGAKIIPVDSEHSALFQSLAGHNRAEVRRLILTASGGPFFQFPVERFGEIRLQDALKHPNWEMGQKITIDSATMMNKALEIIEAMWLFGMGKEQIDVCIHPQSIVHSMVEYVDGSVIAQMGVPDMKGPISYALGYPRRVPRAISTLDLCTVGTLEFLPPDPVRFPALDLAYEVAGRGGTAPAVLNASNEIAVEAFVAGKIGFQDITSIVKDIVGSHQTQQVETIDDVLRADGWARTRAQEAVEKGKVT